MSTRKRSPSHQVTDSSESVEFGDEPTPAAASSANSSEKSKQQPHKKSKTSHRGEADQEKTEEGQEEDDSDDADEEFDYSPLDDACREAARLVPDCTPAQALKEFKRFLRLKVFLRDTDDTKLQPTEVMARVWRAAILDTKFYDALQEHLGMRLHHPSTATVAAHLLQARRQLLRTIYEARYTSAPR
ncbi:hypothetical protein, partial [Dyella sp.]|uniref:hypothetical protein n=1 Tax=Dyella sp. TaxID=1869338 RepID=UPI00283FFC77